MYQFHHNRFCWYPISRYHRSVLLQYLSWIREVIISEVVYRDGSIVYSWFIYDEQDYSGILSVLRICIQICQYGLSNRNKNAFWTSLIRCLWWNIFGSFENYKGHWVSSDILNQSCLLNIVVMINKNRMRSQCFPIVHGVSLVDQPWKISHVTESDTDGQVFIEFLIVWRYTCSKIKSSNRHVHDSSYIYF